MKSIFDKIYAARFNKEDLENRKLLWAVLCRHFFQDYINPQCTVVDMGAGFCEFINAIQAREKIAIDKLAVTKFANSDVTVLEHIEEVKSNSVDVVFMSNFLEHLLTIEKVLEALNKVKKILKEKGRLIIIGPNIRFVYKDYWDFIDHRIPLTDRSLSEALSALGFKIVKLAPKFLPFTSKSQYPQWSWLVKIYLKVPLLWKIFGKQYLIVGENKKAEGQ